MPREVQREHKLKTINQNWGEGKENEHVLQDFYPCPSDLLSSLCNVGINESPYYPSNKTFVKKKKR